MSTNALGVNLSDYADGGYTHEGALFDTAATSEGALADLSKALEAGQLSGNQSMNSQIPGQGAALKVESLEKNLKLLTFKESDIRMWKKIPKTPAYNTVEEFNQLVSYGTDRGGFNLEGELPQSEDSTYVRRMELVKFLGVTRSVTHPMQLVSNSVGNMIQKEISNGTMWILRKVNRALAFGDAHIIPQEFNGLYRQHANNDAYASLNAYMNSPEVIDLRGKSLTQAVIEDAANVVVENWGSSDTLFAPPSVLKNFAKDYYKQQRIIQGGGNSNGITVGTPPKNVSTTSGDIDLLSDLFLKAPGARGTIDGATALKAPTAPVAGATPAVAVADAGFTKFGDSAGDYFYGVATINRFGESTITKLGVGLTTVVVGQAVDLSFTAPASAEPATGFVIYRSKKNPATPFDSTPMYAILSTSLVEQVNGYDGASNNLVRDRNRVLPGTEQAFQIQADEEVYMFKQLAPLMKMDLATLSPSTRFMILLYGTPQLYSAKKMIRFINIGEFEPA